VQLHARVTCKTPVNTGVSADFTPQVWVGGVIFQAHPPPMQPQTEYLAGRYLSINTPAEAVFLDGLYFHFQHINIFQLRKNCRISTVKNAISAYLERFLIIEILTFSGTFCPVNL
jgi:hypothetical protein